MSTQFQSFTTLSAAQLTTTLTATVYTSAGTDGNNIARLFAYNTDSVDRTVTLTLVRKGGTATDAYAEPICAAQVVKAGGLVDLLSDPEIQSALSELQMYPGDTIVGGASANSVVTLVIAGS